MPTAEGQALLFFKVHLNNFIPSAVTLKVALINFLHFFFFFQDT